MLLTEMFGLGPPPPPKPPLGGPPPPTGPMVRMVGLMVVLTDGVEFLTFESVLSTPTAPYLLSVAELGGGDPFRCYEDQEADEPPHQGAVDADELQIPADLQLEPFHQRG
jgi:hypothetical protein